MLEQGGTVTRLVRFAGRRRELAELETRWDELVAGRAGVVLVRGPSGVGKTALVRHFLRELERGDGAPLVRVITRCYELEAVPYRASNGLVDALASALTALPPTEVAPLIPARAELLRRVFPGLGRVPAIAAAPMGVEVRDPLELRSQAFAALRELLQALARHRRLVIFVDDAQWVDDSSLALLADVLRPPDPPALLLVLASRDGASDARSVAALGVPVHTIELEPLAPEAARQLASELVGGADPALADRIALAGGGSPLFIAELARYLEAEPGRPYPATLDEVVRERIAALPARARRVLEHCAIFGEPLAHPVAATALGCTPEELAREVRTLRSARLVRSPAAELLEPHNARHRHAALAALDAGARQALHRALAVAMEQHAGGDGAQLAWHWRGAGESRRAAELARDAAYAAMRAADFERAASLFRIVLELGDPSVDDARALRTALGEALANAGRPAEAAAAFDLAARDADAATRLALRNRSAGELLRGGHVAEGLAMIRAVLAEIGLQLAQTPWRALWSVGWRRAWLRVRGLRWRVRAESEISKAALTRLDVLYSVSMSLAVVDNIRGADYQARHMLLALQVGEPTRLGRAFGLEAGYLVSVGHERRTRTVADLAHRLRKDHGPPQGPYDQWALGGIHYFLDNSWSAAIATFDSVEEELRRVPHGGAWALDTVRAYGLFSRLYKGDLPALARLVPAFGREAERRGDLYASVNLRARLNVVWLMRDDPDGAARDLDRALAAWQPAARGYQVQHYWALVSRCELALYRGDPTVARAHLDAELRSLRRSLLPRVPMVRVELEHLAGRIDLALAQRAPEGAARAALLRQVERHARRLERLRPPLAGMLALLLRAGVAHLGGDRDRAIELLRRALRWLERTETLLYARPARRALGLVTGGDDGARLIAAADAALDAAEVADPAAFSRTYVPGFDP